MPNHTCLQCNTPKYHQSSIFIKYDSVCEVRQHLHRNVKISIIHIHKITMRENVIQKVQGNAFFNIDDTLMFETYLLNTIYKSLGLTARTY